MTGTWDDGEPGSRERLLLERHRPLLRFDPQYDYRVLAAASAVDNAGNLLRRRDGEVIARAGGTPPLGLDTLTAYPAGLDPSDTDCLAMAPDYAGDARRMEWEDDHRGRLYGRVRQDRGRTWLQYWFWLYYNPKNLFGFGKHEGDWEMMQVGLGANDVPEVATCAQHDTGEARPWREDCMAFHPDDPQRPVVYVAPLSHASYFEPGTHPYLLGIDHPRADGPPADLPVVPFGAWAGWPGRWGNTERTIGGRLGNGPPSPSRQGPKWEQPGVWHERMRHRRLRVLLGRAIHRAGRLTYPLPPDLRVLGIHESRVVVEWALREDPGRRGRHLHLTLHQDHYVIASRVVAEAGAKGTTTLSVPPGRTPTAVMGTTYNRLRQRSDPTGAVVAT